MHSVGMWWNDSAALHILVRCVVHCLFLLHRHTRIFRVSHLDVESVMVSISKEAIESKWFG